MDQHKNNPSMSQKIFQLNLPVETTSIYILCSSLADNEKPISTKNIQRIWNGSQKGLINGLEDLEKRNILMKIISDREGNSVYQLIEDEKWKF